MDKIFFNDETYVTSNLRDFSPQISYSKLIAHMTRQTITKRQQELLTLYYLEHKSMTEIAKICGVNKSTVSRTIHRAMKTLHRYLNYSDVE